MSKMVRTPIVLASAENIKSATPLEPLYDEKNKDIIIRNKDGYSNTSIYKTFIDRMDKEGYMSSTSFNNLRNKKIYGFTIDFNESDPYESVIYTNSCVDFEPISFNEDGSCNYGNWYNIIKEFFGVTPCIVSSNGTDRKVLRDVDYTKRTNDDDADIESGDSGDVMVRFIKRYYKLETSDDGILSFKVANYKPDESYVCDAFISENENGYISEYMYIAAYEGSLLDGKLRSLSNKKPTTFKNIEDLRIAINGNYNPININKYVYIQCLIWLLTKNCNTRNLFSFSSSSEKTGSMNKTDLFYKSENGYKLLGIENFLSTSNFIEGAIISSDNIKYKMDGSYEDTDHYKIVAGLEAMNTGYISKMESYNNGLLIPTDVSGSSNGPIGIKNVNKLTEDEYVPLILSLDSLNIGGVKEATSRLVLSKEVNV